MRTKWKALKVISKIIDSVSIQTWINAGLHQPGQKRHIFLLLLPEMGQVAFWPCPLSRPTHGSTVQGLQFLWYYCPSALLHPFSLPHTVSVTQPKIDGKSIKEGDPLAYKSSLSYTQREKETQRGVHWESHPQWGLSTSSKEGQEGCWSKKLQVKSVRQKTQHSIHSRQTPPQCQRGKRSVLYCTSNCSSVMEMHV